ncbi:MAG: hypothetical protein IJQ11_04175 [Bacteroidales bacterium]|nr:hypothetical protein [Bacteroidales bacterium]
MQQYGLLKREGGKKKGQWVIADAFVSENGSQNDGQNAFVSGNGSQNDGQNAFVSENDSK